MELYILMGLMLVAFIGLNMWSKKSQAKRQEEHNRMLKEQLVPGAWVHTRIGFFGRFVDLDGDVLILETPSGEETYWNKAVITTVGDLPFAADEDEIDVDSVPDDAAELTGEVAIEEIIVEEVATDPEISAEDSSAKGDEKN